jgi:hypothetical protein
VSPAMAPTATAPPLPTRTWPVRSKNTSTSN